MQTKVIIPRVLNERVSASGKNFMSIKGNDEKWYAVWNLSLFKHFSDNKPIKVNVEKVGDFNNIVSIANTKITPKEIKQTKKSEGQQFQDAKSKGAARGAAFNKACDIVIALYQRKEIKRKGILPEVKKVFGELIKIGGEE